jgi:cytochrome o ubiquinol oxidase operon protein cyoD
LSDNYEQAFDERAPGIEEHDPTAGYVSYTVGFALAIVATLASFFVVQTNLIWAPGIPVGLIVLALAQIGVHLVFFRQSQQQHDADVTQESGSVGD